MSMSREINKPIIGFTSGDLNGIGIELIIKSLSDNRILDLCTPVVFASNKCINFYRKTLPNINFSYHSVKELNRLNHKQVNIVNCWEEEVAITPGQLTDIGGSYALISLQQATSALKNGDIDALVTAPIHKKNIQSDKFKYSGHTPYFKDFFEVNEVLMFMVADNMRVGLVTEHVPISGVAKNITKENILSKIKIMNQSLKKDFGIDKPKIAVLALNPHAGDQGLIGNEEETVMKYALKDASHSMLVYGPYPADAFFARGLHEQFDGVLAMYHDQGLIPFKSLAFGEGTNFTAGLPVVRTSPDHGTAFDIAGQDKADASSFLVAIFKAIDITRKREEYDDARANPMKKISARIIANSVDEKLEEA